MNNIISAEQNMLVRINPYTKEQTKILDLDVFLRFDDDKLQVVGMPVVMIEPESILNMNYVTVTGEIVKKNLSHFLKPLLQIY